MASSHRRQVIGARPTSRFYGISASPLPEYRPHLQNYFDYAHKLNIWANALGKSNVVVSSFDEIRQRGVDIVEDFARKAKVSFSIPANKNSSLSGNSTYLGLRLTEIGLDPDHIQDILDRVDGTSPFLPTKDEARAFLAHFADANERLARDWGLEFDMSFDRYPESADHRWSNADVDAMLNALLAELKKNKNPS